MGHVNGRVDGISNVLRQVGQKPQQMVIPVAETPERKGRLKRDEYVELRDWLRDNDAPKLVAMYTVREITFRARDELKLPISERSVSDALAKMGVREKRARPVPAGDGQTPLVMVLARCVRALLVERGVPVPAELDAALPHDAGNGSEA